MAKRSPDEKKRWEEAMEAIASKFTDGVTSDDLYTVIYKGSEKDPADVTRRKTATSQLLRRLRQYGYLRPGEPQYNEEGRGRPMTLYHMTEKARKRFGS